MPAWGACKAKLQRGIKHPWGADFVFPMADVFILHRGV